MGIRQPTAVGSFFAQAAAGAQKQQQAREKLKKPQALGGAASAGTQMIASENKAQQQATSEVNKQAESASKELVAGNVGTSTTSMIAGTQQPAAPVPAPVQTPPTATAATFKGGIAEGPSNIPKLKTVTSGESGDIGAVNASAQVINFNVKNLEDQIAKLDEQLKNANNQDAVAINAEKTKLNEALAKYQKMIDEGNIGQIAGQSNLESQMQEREQILAEQNPYLENGVDTSIAKLSTIFGPRWRSKSAEAKALAAQAYGQDLEVLGNEAAAGLREREKTLQEADQARQGFSGTLESSKKTYEESLKKQSDQLDILKKSPDELKTYTRTQLESLFGKDMANRLFQFTSEDPNATVSNTSVSKTRTALTTALESQKTEQGKIEGEQKKANEKISTDFGKEVDVDLQQVDSFLNPDDPLSPTFISVNTQSALNKIKKQSNSWFGGWKGMTKDSYVIRDIDSLSQSLNKEIEDYRSKLNNTKKSLNRKELDQIRVEYQEKIRKLKEQINNKYGELTSDGRNIMGVR